MVAACSFGATSSVMAQEDVAATEVADSAAVDSAAVDTAAVEEAVEAAPIVEEENEGVFKNLKTKFIEGGAGFMSLVAIALVLGLAFCIERVVYLTLAQINTRKFMKELADLVAAGKIADAIEKCNAESVIVLPNNGNIRMAAEAAANACDSCDCAVVPTKTVLQAFAAMFVADPEGDLDANVEEMTDAIGEIRDGEVTSAVRDSAAADGTPIHSGDVMGIMGGSIEVVGSSVQDVTLEVINRMQEEEEGDTLTILAGSDLDDDAFQKLVDAIEEAQPDLEIDSHRGEQPLYPVVFSIE